MEHVSLREGLETIRLVVAPNFEDRLTVDFGREFLALVFLNAGSAELSIGSEEIPLANRGQALRFGADHLEISGWQCDGSTQIQVFLCSRQLVTQLYGYKGAKEDCFLHSFLEDETDLLPQWIELSLPARPLVRQISAFQTDHLKHRLELESSALALVAEVFIQSAEMESNPIIAGVLNASDRDAIQRIIDRFQESPGEDYTLKDLCTLSGINENKLKSAFKQLYGQTTFAYLRQVRMDHASQLLKEDRLSVIQVANEVGYTNASHFARAFKNQHGILPKAYQCIHRIRPT